MERVLDGLDKFTTYFIKVRGKTSKIGNASKILNTTTYEDSKYRVTACGGLVLCLQSIIVFISDAKLTLLIISPPLSRGSFHGQLLLIEPQNDLTSIPSWKYVSYRKKSFWTLICQANIGPRWWQYGPSAARSVQKRVTRKHWSPVRGPPLRTGSTDYPMDRSTDYLYGPPLRTTPKIE